MPASSFGHALPRHPPHCLACLAAVQSIESEHQLSRPRWDIPYFLGKLVEKTRRLTHPGKTYADLDRLEPGWLSTLLAYYQRALDLAETKASRTSAFYRLHATRLRILRDDLRPGDVALPPNPAILKVRTHRARRP